MPISSTHQQRLEEQTSRSTLTACLRLSKEWSPAVMDLICQHIVVRSDNVAAKWQHVCQTVLNNIEKDPTLYREECRDRRRFVKGLSVINSVKQDLDRDSRPVDVTCQLGPLPCLENLELHGLRLDVSNLFQALPTLRGVKLVDCVLDLTSSIVEARKLEHLELDRVAVARRNVWSFVLNDATFPRLQSLALSGPLDLGSNEEFVEAFQNIVEQLKHVSLAFEPKWEPTGPSALQLNLWITSLLPRCTKLDDLKLKLVTSNPWLALTMRSATLAWTRRDTLPTQHDGGGINKLVVVLEPSKENQPKRDLAICFSRLMLIELKSGSLPGLRQLGVVDGDDDSLNQEMVTSALRDELGRRGIELI
ncbi:hypothetical protein OIO90_003192 [Microbotryomycetes sp. JL221]|nr:hypothetical protein OIO90_003192 [Microbotryomycetes sp. JL221]